MREKVCCIAGKESIEQLIHGLWRSLVARSSGGRKVVSSNLASPTKPVPKEEIRRNDFQTEGRAPISGNK